LLVLISAVGVLLLIACANIANLLLSRAPRAIVNGRAMLSGASPRRIATHADRERIVGGAGAALGLLFAVVGLRLIRRLPDGQSPRREQVRLDPIVLLFAVGVTAVCALMFGLAPALRAARVDLQTNLKDGARGSASGSARRLSNAFVVVQFALSLVLLAGSGLLLKSFQRLLSVNPGFRAENVLVARLQPPYPRYADAQAVRGFYDRLLDRVATIPGVRAVGLTPRARSRVGIRRTTCRRGEGAEAWRASRRLERSQYHARLLRCDGDTDSQGSDLPRERRTGRTQGGRGGRDVRATLLA
jgi:putative ABC transport system permease protein